MKIEWIAAADSPALEVLLADLRSWNQQFVAAPDDSPQAERAENLASESALIRVIRDGDSLPPRELSLAITFAPFPQLEINTAGTSARIFPFRLAPFTHERIRPLHVVIPPVGKEDRENRMVTRTFAEISNRRNIVIASFVGLPPDEVSRAARVSEAWEGLDGPALRRLLSRGIFFDPGSSLSSAGLIAAASGFPMIVPADGALALWSAPSMRSVDLFAPEAFADAIENPPPWCAPSVSAFDELAARILQIASESE